ncbi:MAG: hypothetical protein VX278_23810 [Myxococcota bacterium]|nr:hypothetical protein [Myxococcota bacterium]
MLDCVGLLAATDGAQLGKMITGLSHSHSGLANLVFVASLVNIAFALSVSKNPIPLAKMMQWGHRIVLFGGRLNLILGFIWLLSDPQFQNRSILSFWWVLVSILCWGGIEVAAKRMVKSDLSVALVGGAPSKSLFWGFIVELVLILLIYAMMSVKSWH